MFLLCRSSSFLMFRFYRADVDNAPIGEAHGKEPSLKGSQR